MFSSTPAMSWKIAGNVRLAVHKINFMTERLVILALSTTPAESKL